ncbi:unnamed protein product, partial [Ilex paraguariensis]
VMTVVAGGGSGGLSDGCGGCVDGLNAGFDAWILNWVLGVVVGYFVGFSGLGFDSFHGGGIEMETISVMEEFIFMVLISIIEEEGTEGGLKDQNFFSK